MKQLISQKNLFALWCYILIASLFYSPFVLSVSIFALLFLSVFRITNQDGLAIRFNALFFNSFRQLLRHPAYLAVALLFIVYLCSGINSDNTTHWLEHIKVKAPLLAFPIIFLNRPPVDKLEYQKLYYWLLVVSFLSAIQVSINYMINFEAITYSIGSGHTIPTPTHHTRYSTIVAISILGTIAMHLSSYSMTKLEKVISVGAGLFLFVFLHVLSIRSGLLALYLGIFVLGFLYLIKAKKYSLMLIFLLAICLVPWIAYKSIPSFYNKVHYTRYDYKMNSEGRGANYSDSERILSIKTGLDLFKNHPALGTGIGDLSDEVEYIYYEEYKKNLARLPHNQFVFVLAGMGFILGIVYLLSFFAPLLSNKNYLDLVMLALFLGATVLCMVEKPMERTNFIAFYSLFVCAGISYNLGRKKPKHLKH